MTCLSLLVSQNLYSQCADFVSYPPDATVQIILALGAGGTVDLNDAVLNNKGFVKNPACDYYLSENPGGPWAATPVTFDCTDVSTSPQTWYVRVDGVPPGNSGGPGATVRTLAITVVDNIPPTILINPFDDMRPADGGVCTYLTTGTEFDATIADNCDVIITYLLSGATSGTHVGTLDGVMLNAGITTVNFSAVDPSNNVSNGVAYLIEVDDNESPVIASCPADLALFTAPGSCSSALSNITAPAFPGSITENCDIVSIDWAATGATTTNGSGNVATNFNLGMTTVTYTATDAAGNTGTCSFEVTVTDDEDPGFTGTTSSQSIGTSTGTATPLNLCDGFLGWNHPSVTDNCVGPYTMTIAFSGATVVAAAPASQGAATTQFFNLGATTVTYVATDANGNTGSNTFVVTVTDNQAPVVTPAPANVNFPAQSVTAGDCSKVITFTRPSIGTVSDCGVVTFTETVFSSPDPMVLSGAPAFPPTGGGSVTVQFPTGTTVIRYTWTDNASPANSVFMDYTFIVNEDEAPDAQCKTPGTIVLALDATGKVILTPAMVDNGSSDNCGNVILTITSAQGDAVLNGLSFDCGDLANNAIPVTLSVSDLATPANTDVCNTTIDIVDNLAPQVICPASIALPTNSGNCTATFNGALTLVPAGTPLTTVGQYTDNCSAPTVTYNLSGVTTGSGSYAGIGAVPFNKGTTAVTYTFSDGSNSTVCNFNVTVSDLQPPSYVMGQAANTTVTVFTNVSSCLRQVNWVAPTFTDNCPGVVSVTSTHTPGSFFQFGMTTVTYTATDAAGNVRIHSFKVNVVDIQAPTAKCKDVTVSLDVNGDATVLPTEIDNGSTDNCFFDYYEFGTLSALLNEYNFDCSDLGVNTVVLDLRDGQGNQDTCNARVTVIDDIPPTALCIGNQTYVLNGAGQFTLNAATLNNGSTDNCGTLTYQLKVGAGSYETSHLFNCSQIGTFTVTLQVTDAGGNTAECTLNVTIKDMTNPVVTPPANVVVECVDFDPEDASTSGGVATATDNCSVVSVTYTTANDIITPGICGNEFTIQRKWIATDASGNTGFAFQVISVEDNESPVWDLPGMVMGETDVPTFCDGPVSFEITSPGSITDACGAVTVTFTVDYPNPSFGYVDIPVPQPLAINSDFTAYFPIGTSVVTLVATDACGNTASHTVSIVIKDTQGPIFAFDQPFDTICGAHYVIPNTPGACSNVFTWERPWSLLGNVADCLPFTVQEQILNSAGSTSNSVQTTINLTNPFNYNANFPFQVFPTAQFPVGVTTIRYIAKDNAVPANTSVCEFTVEIKDTQIPILNCPANQVLSSTCPDAQIPNYTSLVQVSDNCSGNVTLTQIPAGGTSLGTFFGPAPTTGDNDTIFVTGFDGYNTTTCFFKLTLQDGDDPIPAEVTLDPIVDSCGMFIVFAPIAFDPCNPAADTIYGTPSAQVGEFLNTDPPSYNLMPGNYVITWVYNDGNGNISTQPQNITVLVDIFPPVSICKPDSVNLSAGGSFTIAATQLDNGSYDQNDCGPITYKFKTGPTTFVDSLTFTCAQLGNNVVNFVAIDINNNVSTPCVTTVKVKDVVAPVLQIIPANITLNCQDVIPTAPTLTASDSCSVATVTFTETSTKDTIGCGKYTYMITRTWSAVDAAGNTSTGTQKINVQDVQAPLFLPSTPDTINAFTATNNTDCSAKVNINILQYISDCSTGNDLSIANLEGFYSKTDTMETFGLGVHTTTFFATDACGNKSSHKITIVVEDGTNPIAACINGVSVSLQASGTVLVTTAQINAASSDNCTTTDSLVLNIQRLDPLGPVTTEILFNCDDADGVTHHPVSLSVTDLTGNTSTCQTYIVVQDNVAPAIVCPANKTIQCSDPIEPQANGTASATDNCQGTIMITFSDTLAAGTGSNCLVLNRYWQARDLSGNVAVCVQKLNIQDTIAPVLSSTAPNDTVSCYSLVPSPVLITATDNCSDSVEVLLTQDTINVAVGPCGNYNYTIVRTRTAVDDCGNTTTHTRTITIIDNQAPQFLGMPDTLKIFTANYPPNDSCSANIGLNEFDVRQYLNDCQPDSALNVFNDSPKGDHALSIAGNYPVGIYEIHFEALDACGNLGKDTLILQIIDNSIPTVVCNNNITISLGSNGSATITPQDVALTGTTDNCAIDTMYLSQTTFVCSELGINPLTLFVVDNAGNVNSCTVDVEVTMGATAGFNLEVTATPESYFGSDDGTALATATGGSGNFSFEWETGDTTSSLDHLSAGSYIITVTDDDNGCLQIDTAIVDEGAKIQLIAGNATGCQSGLITIPVTVENFFEVYSFSFTVNAGDGTVATVTGVTNVNPALTGFTGSVLPFNNLGAVWTGNGTPQIFTDGTKLFDLQLQLSSTAAVGSVAPITIVATPVGIEFNQDSTGVPVIVPIDITTGSATINCDADAIDIAGDIQTWRTPTQPVPGVTVTLSGGATGTQTTGVPGTYLFSDIPNNTNVTLTPAKTTAGSAGISSADLLFIVNHIFGTQLLSPYQWVAADVNGDANISLNDYLRIQRVVLATDQHILGSPDWKFVPKAYTFPSPNPLSAPIPQTIMHSPATMDYLDDDFVAVRMGDVNGNITPTFTGNQSEERFGDGKFHFRIDNNDFKAGEIISVPFRASDFNQRIAYQMTIDFDAAVLMLDNYEAGVLPLTDDNFGTTYLADGHLTTLWVSREAKSFGDNEVLFTLKFRALRNGNIADLLHPSSAVTAAEGYNFDGSLMKIDFEFTERNIADEKAPFTLYQNQPNPFQSVTTIGFRLPESSRAALRVFNASGQLVRTVIGNFEKGYNEVRFRESELGNAGVYYYELETPTHSDRKKMILID
ncbi:MAG TPA: HYR domain-containing protein [Saprospiraceae bacterium]|nr:HYR domain-containing protein [Saprospiraceae bacterium]